MNWRVATPLTDRIIRKAYDGLRRIVATPLLRPFGAKLNEVPSESVRAHVKRRRRRRRDRRPRRIRRDRPQSQELHQPVSQAGAVESNEALFPRRLRGRAPPTRIAASNGVAKRTRPDLLGLLCRQRRRRGRPVSSEHEIARAHSMNRHEGRSQKDVADFVRHGPLHAIVGDCAGRKICGVAGAPSLFGSWN